MVQIHLIMTILLIMQAQSESRTVNAKNNRVVMNKKDVIDNRDAKRCDEISQLMLNDILGAAFNSRWVFETISDMTVKGLSFGNREYNLKLLKICNRNYFIFIT